MINKNELIDAVICKESDSVLEVSKIMRDTQQRHIIVINKKQEPIGIISTVDINNRVVASEKNPKETKASEIMTSPVDLVEVDESYEAAYKKMIQRGTYTIPVTEKNRLIGVLDFNLVFKQLSKNKGETK